MVGDLVEAVAGKGEHEHKRLRPGAAQRVPDIWRDVDGTAGPHWLRTVLDVHLASPADDEIDLGRLMAVTHEFRARRDLGDPGSQVPGLGSLSGDQQLPANPLSRGKAGVFAAFPLKIGLVAARRSR